MNDHQKWAFLSSIVDADARHPKIKRLATDLLDAADRNATRFVMLAHTVARDWIHQVSDTIRTGGEDIAGLTRHPTPEDAVDALERGTDDCDAKARLFVALCRAVGVRANVVPYWRLPGGPTYHRATGNPREQLYHVAAEVQLMGKWLPVELTLARARLGEPGERVPLEPGKLKWLET